MAHQIKNKKSKKITIKTDAFELAINDISKLDGFNAELIIECFKRDKIRSSDFCLNGFKTRQEFVVDFCETKHNISKDKVAKGKLIKLYQGLNNKYRILKPCMKININIEYPNIWSSGSLVFISPRYTQEIIDNNLILESQTLSTPKRLYQYLNWTIRVNKINKYINCFKSINNIKFLVINCELHNKNGDELYIFCIENDIISDKAQKWQFVKLLTSAQLMQYIVDPQLDNIVSNLICDGCSVSSVICSKITSIIGQFTGRVLPNGARKSGKQFYKFKQENINKETILNNNNNLQYSQLKGIQTGYDKKNGIRKGKLEISLNEFEECIYNAVQSKDPHNDLIPIVSILSGKKYGNGDYSVDQVLPVNIKNNWVGICYRNGKPVMVLFDGYDITNKAILCKPDFDKNKLSFFENNISKIVLTNNKRNNHYQPRARQLPSSQRFNASATSSSTSSYNGFNQYEESDYDCSSYPYSSQFYDYYSTSSSSPVSSPVSTPMASPQKTKDIEYKYDETKTTDPGTYTFPIKNGTKSVINTTLSTSTATAATIATATTTTTNTAGQEGSTSYASTTNNNVLTEGYCGNQTTLITNANLFNFIGGYQYNSCNTNNNNNNNTNSNNISSLPSINNLNNFNFSNEGLQTWIDVMTKSFQQQAQYFQQFSITPTPFINVNPSCLIQQQQQQEIVNVEQINKNERITLDATTPEFVPSPTKKNKFVSKLMMITEGEATI